jgi:hypothetical protein
MGGEKDRESGNRERGINRNRDKLKGIIRR